MSVITFNNPAGAEISRMPTISPSNIVGDTSGLISIFDTRANVGMVPKFKIEMGRQNNCADMLAIIMLEIYDGRLSP
jgi:hypothetical protein